MTRDATEISRLRAGFTLVELLVALAILGLISAIALGGVRLGARTWETVSAKAEENSQTQMVRTFLSRALSQAAAVLVADPEGGQRLAFEGDQDSLIFVAPLSPHFAVGGYQRLELSLLADNPGGSMRLVLKREPFYPGGEPEAEHRQDDEDEDIHFLLDGIEEAVFEYRGDPETKFAEWSAEWRGPEVMPTLVRLRIRFADPWRNAWPDLVVARRVTTDPGCLPPIRGAGCRHQ